MTVVDITAWESADEETLGTKSKQCVRSASDELWLWKESTLQRDLRHGAFRKGDDWSEVADPPAPSAQLATACDWFAGYLVLDALVGNTDRYQDNLEVDSSRRQAASVGYPADSGIGQSPTYWAR